MRIVLTVIFSLWLALATTADANDFKSSTAGSEEEMVFSLASSGGNCGGCEWIAAEGMIVRNTPQKFQSFIEEHGSYRRTVVLNSGGGDLIAGLELGQMFRDIGLWTSIGQTIQHAELGAPYEDQIAGMCASACAYAFLGGVERFASEGELGVHQFYGLEDTAPRQETQEIVGYLLIYLMKMGIDWEVLAHSLFTGSDDMYWFTEADLSDFSASTESNGYTEPWRIEPHEGGLVATAMHHASATEAAQMSFFCRRADGRWRLLISERISETVHLPDWPELRQVFSRDSNIWFSERQLSLNGENLEFMKAEGPLSYLSITLPIDLIESAGDRFWYWLYDWKSARFMVKGEVPSLDWLSVLKKNCV